MAKRGRSRGGRGGGSDMDSPTASPAGRGRRNRGGQGGSRGHMGFSTGSFGVMGDDSLNNSDAGAGETEHEDVRKKIHHTREEHVNVHMEGGGNAEFYSDLSRVHVQSTAGRAVHISVGNKEIAQRYREMQAMEQGAIRSMHCDDKMMHHRLSKMSINSNADEFIFVGGRPSDVQSSHSHERSPQQQIPEIQINAEPQEEQRVRYRSRSMSHNNQEAFDQAPQFNVVRGPVIQMERHSQENFDQELDVLAARNRSASRASVRSHQSGRNIPIEMEFGGPAGEEIVIPGGGGNISRAISRVSVRSAHQEHYGQNQDNLGFNENNGLNARSRSISRASVHSHMSNRDIPIEAEFGGPAGEEIVIPGSRNSRPISRASSRSAHFGQEDYGFNQEDHGFNQDIRSRSVSRASVRSHMSDRDIPIEEFGGPACEEIIVDGGSRPVSRASARSARFGQHYYEFEENQDNHGFGHDLQVRPQSRASVRSHNSNFGREVVLEDDQDGYQRSRTVSQSTDADLGVAQIPQFGEGVGMDYGAAFDNRARRSASNLQQQDSIGLNTTFDQADSQENGGWNQQNGGDSYNIGRSGSKISINSGRGDFGEDNLNTEFDEGVRSRSHSRLDLRAQADEIYEHDEVSGGNVSCGKGMPSGFSDSLQAYGSDLHSRMSGYQQEQQERERMETTAQRSRMASHNEQISEKGTGHVQNYGYGKSYQESHHHVQERTRTEEHNQKMMEYYNVDGNRGSSEVPHGFHQPVTNKGSGYIQGDYHNVGSSQSQSSSWSHSVTDGGKGELHPHYEDVNAMRTAAQTQMEEYQRSILAQLPQLDSKPSTGSATFGDMRPAASHASLQSTGNGSVFGSTGGLNRNPEGVFSAASQISIPSQKAAARISLLTDEPQPSDPTRFSMKERPLSSRHQSITQKGTNVASTHVIPILKLPPKASMNVPHKTNVGFSAMPELFSHPDEKFGASPGVKFRSTALHQKTPARPRSTSVTIGLEPVVPPVPAPRTSVTSIPDISVEIKGPAMIETPKAPPKPLIYTDALTPRVDRMSLGDHCCESPSALNVTQITISRTASTNQPQRGIEITTQMGGKMTEDPKLAPHDVPPTATSIPVSPNKPTFNNSFETRGHPGANALNVMFANRAKEDASANKNEARSSGVSRSYQTTAIFSRQTAVITQPDHNSNEIVVNKNVAPAVPENRSSSNLRNLALHELKLPTTPKSSRISVFKKGDRMSGMPRDPPIASSSMWKPPVSTAVPKPACDHPLVVPKSAPIANTKGPFATKDAEKPQEPLRKLPQQTWIVYNQNSPPRDNESRMKPLGGGDCLSPAQITRPKEPRHMRPPPGFEHVAEKPAAWNRPATPPPPAPKKAEKQPQVQPSNSKVTKKAGDTVRQNLRPGQIRNLASMFDHIQAKATEEELVLRGNSLRSSASRTGANSEANDSDREETDAVHQAKDESFVDERQPLGHYRSSSVRQQGDDFTDNHQGVFYGYENAGLHNALSDYDENDHRFRNAVPADFHEKRREEQYFDVRSVRSEDPAIQSSFEDGRHTPRGSVKALAAGFETSGASHQSPAQQRRRNVSHVSKASEHLRTARETSRHEASNSSRFSHHASYHSNRFDQEEPSYAKVQKKKEERIREEEYLMMMDDRHRYAEIHKERRPDDDYAFISEKDARTTISMTAESNYARSRDYEDQRSLKSARDEGDYCVIREGRRVSGRFDDVAEDKSVNGHIDNLFGFVDEHLGSDKLVSSREFLSSDNEEVRRKPLTYSMSGYRAMQRGNRRGTSTVTREDILAAQQKPYGASSQAGTMASRHDAAPARFSPAAAPNAAELSQGGIYGKTNSTAASGKRYVVGSALATSTPQQSPRNTVSQYATTQHHHSRMEDTSFVSSITDVSRTEVDYKQQIARLEHIVKMNNQQISMLYKALSQARKDSKPIQEMNAQKTLLIAKERVALLQREIKRLRALSTVRRPPPPQSRDVRGSLTISNVAIHLNRSFYTRTYELNCSYTFVVLFKCGTEVEAMAPVTLLANHQNRLRTIHFTEKVNFSNLPVDFCVLLEVYALALSENKQEELSCASAFASKCRNLLPKERKALTSPSGFPIGEFVRCGYIQLTRDTTSSNKFYLDETEYPLDGTIDINSHCTTLPPSIEVDYRGFLTMYQNVSGMSSWERYWAVLRRGTILFWKYPDDESMEKQPKARLDLSTCTQNEVGPCTPELCPRPFTFTVNVLFPTAPSVMDKKRLFLSADSRELLKAWLDAVNETLSIIRG